MTNTSTILLFFLMCFCENLFSQVDSITLNKARIRSDSIHIQGFKKNLTDPDVFPSNDSLPPVIAKKGIAKIAAEQDLEDVVEYGSKDSSELDNTNQILRLWGDAYVYYQTYKIKANYIQIDLKNNIATAEVGKDARGRPLGKPDVLIDKQQVVANKLSFNFKTKKGIIHDGRLKQNDLYINGSRIKVIAGPVDSINTDDVIYQQDALITTCNHPEAHFGIQASRMKVVPDKVAVIGASYVKIGGVPTPLVLPFGFFPMKRTKQTGILFPNDYNFSPQWGYGLKNIGYYIPINEHLDFIVQGDIYLRGSHRIGVTANYNTRYKYSGAATLEYSTLYGEVPNDYKKTKSTSYRLTIRHVQDPKANPYHKFGGNANIELGKFQTLNYNDANSALNNNLSSNITYSRIFSGKPYSFSASLSHSQQLVTRDFTLELPNLNFNTQSIFPFKNEKNIGSEKWYDQISFTYSAELKNRFSTKDSLLFTKQTLESSKQGMRQNLNVTSSYKVLKYFNISPNFTYSEVWGFNEVNQIFDPTILYRSDTTFFDDTKDSVIRIDIVPISNGMIVKDTIHKFSAYRTYSASVALNTQLFGLMQFKKGFIRGIRHQIRPSISLAFAPDYRSYYESIQTSNDPSVLPGFYTRYQENIYGGPPNSGPQMGLNFSLNNTLEAKIMSRRDTVARKVKIFESFGINTFYNFVADTLKLNPLTYNATTRLFKGLSTLSMNGNFDFYDRNSKGQKINIYLWNSQKKIARFVTFNATLNTSLTVQKIRKFLSGNLSESEAATRTDKRKLILSDQSFWELLDNFSINHTVNLNVRDEIGRNKFRFNTNSVSVSGSLPITEKWAINVGYFGYDFKNQSIVYPDLGFSRDLHCWQMSLNWQPVRGTYSFTIGVKPGTLDFLKVPNSKNRQDVFTNF